MDEVEFDRFLAGCTAALELKQAELQAEHDMGRNGRWQLDEHEGILSICEPDGQVRLHFAVTPIGTFSSSQDSWKWAWANTHLHQPLRDRAAAIKALHAKTDFECFVFNEPFPADAGMAWELAAAAVEELGALGCYRAPHRDTWLFLALERVLP